MSPSATFTVELEAITPIFMGGARRDDPAELRVPSLKGLLRYWYRAVDPGYRQREPRIFGGAGEGRGQAPFLMAIPRPVTGVSAWRRDDFREFQKRFGDVWRNGATYAGFSLEGRRAIGAGQRLTIHHYLAVRATHDPEVLRALCASWWLLAHVGGLGSRCRRGLGSVALRSWSATGVELPTGCPPLPPENTDVAGWWRAFEGGLRSLRKWYPARHPSSPDHLVLDDAARFILVEAEDANTWQEGLDRAGRLLQDFRQKRIDYREVLSHVTHSSGHGGQALRDAPKRAAFGLPLPFFFRKARAKATFRGERHDRSASRVWLRVVRAGGRYHPLIARLSGPLLESGERLIDTGYVDQRGAPLALWHPPGEGVLNRFCDRVASTKRATVHDLKGVWK